MARSSQKKARRKGGSHRPHGSLGAPEAPPGGREREQLATAPSSRRGDSPRPSWWLLPVLLLVTLAAYQPVWRGGLLWDDDHHLTTAELQTTEGLVRIWTDLGATQQYYPVVHTAFWLEHRLWGDDTLGYHVVNISLHALAAFLLAVLLGRLGVPGGWLAAFLFALHPVHVETVAWISELKNTLSTVFYLLAALAYLRFDRSRNAKVYGAALLLFLLALGSKTVTATLPAALLVVFWWKRGRLDRQRDVLPLVPFLLAGLGGGAFTAWVEHAYIGAHGAAFDLTWIERALVAGRALWFYAAKLVWPVDLVFTYPRWTIDEGVWWQYLYPIAAITAFGLLWRFRLRSRAPLAVALIFAGTLVPALGFVDVYPFRFSFVADHFQYLASMSVIAGVAALNPRPSGRAPASMAVAAVVVTALGFLTWSESHSYVSAETLYRETIRRNPEAWIAHSNLGGILLDERPAEAAEHVEQALRLNPDLAEAHNNRGILLHRAGRLAEALSAYERAARLEPGLARAHNNRCLALTQLGRAAEALAACETALALDPDYPEALYHSAAALQMVGRAEEATGRLERAVELDPSYAEVHYQLGLAYQRSGRLDAAISHLRTAAELRPRFAEARNDLGLALVQAGRLDDAVAAFTAALGVRPDFADASFNLANTLLTLGRPAEAVPRYEASLEVKPDDGAAHNNLGVALLQLGRARDAVPHFREAIRLSPDLAQARDNLRRALAEGGGR